jgi:hypothetical protein
MPTGTTPAELFQAQITGITKTTRVLDALFEAQDPNVIGGLRRSVPIDPNWLRTVLQLPGGANPDLGMKPEELDHVLAWPGGQRELVRAAVLNAIDSGRNVRFRWRLGNGASEATQIDDPGSGDIVITFCSPESRKRQRAQNDIHVDVGTADSH